MSRLFTMENGRRRVLKGIAAGGAGVATASLWSRSAWAQDDTIRIGFPTPLTGPFGAEAKDQVQAAELAIKHFNEEGGLKGRKAVLLVRDDKLKPGEAATRTLELIEKDKVHFIVGALSASVQLAVNEVAKARGIIYNSISQSDSINEAKDFSKYTFHEAMNPHMTAGAVGRYAFKKGQKVAFLTADYAYGHEMVRGFRRVADEMGLTVLDDIRHPAGSSDYSIFLPRIQALKPDVLAICNFGRDQLEEKMPSAKKFNDAYRAAYGGTVPSDYGAYGYVGVKSVLDAARQAGTTDSDAVIAALESMKYDYYKGPQYFRKCDHQSVQPILIVESKKQSEMRNPHDVFNILEIEQGSEKVLRSCSELGHSA